MRMMKPLLASALLGAFATAAQANSTIDDMVAASLATCADAKSEGYAARLKSALEEASPYAATLHHNGVTVCLDQRLGNQAGDKYNQTMVSAYYNTGGAKILSLYDTGAQTRRGAWLDGDVHAYSERSLRGFALGLENGEVSLSAKFLPGASYRLGKNRATRWSAPEDFDATTLAKNPALRNAPLRK